MQNNIMLTVIDTKRPDKHQQVLKQPGHVKHRAAINNTMVISIVVVSHVHDHALSNCVLCKPKHTYAWPFKASTYSPRLAA